jgi:predicted phage terminase large subunit-like protein
MEPEVKALLRSDLLSFARKAILDLDGTRIGYEPYLRYLADELKQFGEGKSCRMIVNLPPGHLKTQLCSVCLSAWLLAHDPSLKIMVVTHAEHLSKMIARNIRTILQSAWFKGLFATRIALGHAEVVDFGTKSGGVVFVTSFNGRFTGRRADVIIVDDPHDIGDNVEQIKKTIERFKTTLLSRLNDRKTGRVLVVAHRINERDLSASLLRKKKNWKHIVLQLIATATQTYGTGPRKWHRRKGELLRPNVFGPEDLEELREDNINPDFEMLYQQDFDCEALPAISADHFPTISELAPPGAPIVLSVDTGMANSRRSAWSVIQAWRIAAGHYYLVDQFRDQCEFSDLNDALLSFRKSFKPVAILIERATNGPALISQLKRRSRKLYKLVMPIDPDGRSKSARLRVHAETIIAKRIHLPADAPWRDDFISEIAEFPHGRFSDQVDAMTQFLDHAGKFVGVKASAKAGLAVLSLPSSAQTKMMSCSAGGEPGRIAGVRSDGQPLTGHQARARTPLPPFKVWLR